MFVISDAEIAAIQAAFERGGELCASVELRRLFPGIAPAIAKDCARTIAGWKPLRVPPRSVRRPPAVRMLYCSENREV
jgi:hypothetical protein